MTEQQRFQVDLRGVVDLLSHHLYTSPRVFARELIQNAADAITARRALAPPVAGGGSWAVRIEVHPDGPVTVHDDGIGLTEAEVHTFLSSVGRTSKRDELGFARQDFLGQFGIGLLSCFMVADTIEVTTRSARGGAAVRWTGYTDGRYATVVDDAARVETGTSVTLRPRPDAAHWLTADTLRGLVRGYAHLLEVPIWLDTPDGPARLTDDAAPWEPTGSASPARREALLEYGTTLLGSRPLDVIDLRVPEAGLTGVGFVLPTRTTEERRGHRVYLKRMLLHDNATGLLPEWAFFVRAVVDSSGLRPTASREALYEDDLLSAVRASLGEQIRNWLLTLSVTQPERLAAFLRIHHLGVKALAVRDDEMLRLVDEWLPFETSRGTMPLRTFRKNTSMIRYVATVDEFRSLAAVASAAGTPVVNGGYAYDTEILQRLPRIAPTVEVRQLDPGELAARLTEPRPDQLAAAAAMLDTAATALTELDCRPELRLFDPVSVPALFVVGQDTRYQRQLRQEATATDELWSDVLSAFDDVSVDHRPVLVLNWRHPLIRRLAEYPAGPTLRNAIEALYGQALLAGHHPLRAADNAALNRSFLSLLEQAFADPAAERGRPRPTDLPPKDAL